MQDREVKRIAFIHNVFPAGGAERITMDIARYLHSVGGYEIFVYASRTSEDHITDEIRNVLTLRKIPAQAIPALRACRIKEHIVHDKVQIVVQVTKAIPGMDSIRRELGVKTVVACHGEPFWQRYAIVYRRQKGLFRKMMWHLYNRRRYDDGTLALKKAKDRTIKDYTVCDAYTVLCDSYKAEVISALGLNADSSHIHVIENPERIRQDVCFEKEKIFLFCGRFENWSKRIDRLFRIWKRVQDRLPEWRLVLVGDGPDAGMLRQLAVDMGLERVCFEGRRNNIEDYYRKASVVCLTSQTEGWPLALSEAQANGCIGVAFGCTSGISEILAPEEGCGFVVPPFDEELYAGTLMKIASLDEGEKMLVRKNAVNKRLGYAPEVIAEKWRCLFDTLV